MVGAETDAGNTRNERHVAPVVVMCESPIFSWTTVGSVYPLVYFPERWFPEAVGLAVISPAPGACPPEVI